MKTLSRWLAQSLAARVALASAIAAALGGSAAALSMGVTARELSSKHETKRLATATKKLAKEVVDELRDDDGDEPPRAQVDGASEVTQELTRALADELEDVKYPGATAAIHTRGGAIVGDRRLVRLRPGECELLELGGQTQRACTVAIPSSLARGTARFDGGSLTLAVPTDVERERNALLARALLVGLLCGALLGGVASYWLSRWALAPLSRLRDRVRAIDADDPQSGSLAADAERGEVEELRLAIASLVDRLGSALRAAQAFAGEAAHELRTPLTTIAGELELAAESSGDGAASLVAAREQVERLTELVQRLLVLAQPNRVDTRSAEIIDLSDVDRAAVNALPALARARLSAEVEDDVIVRGDASLLRALLVNGYENALKFSTGPVLVRIGKSAGQARIDIIDEGPGVAPEERDRVFEPFYRAASVRASKAGGHGMGLPLIARVAWVHNGRAQFLDSARGAHLRVELPLWTPLHD